MRRIGVSNLAWPAEAESRALAMLAEKGAQGIEVAPTRIADWEALTPDRLRAFRRAADGAGLAISSLQAVFFNRPDCGLLDDETRFLAMSEHMRRLAAAAAALDARVAVFGAPKSRLRGALAEADAFALAVERLRRLGDLAQEGGLVIGMEPVPPVYGADFLQHASDMVALVRECDHPGVRAHLDTACVTLAGDDPSEAIRAAVPLLVHYHMAEPELGPFDRLRLDHAAAGRTLDEVGYRGWVVIEMRQGEGDGLPAIATAIEVARRCYGGTELAPH